MNIIQGYNVALRTWEPEDIEGYSEMASNHEVMKFISSGETRSKDVVEQEIARFRALTHAFDVLGLDEVYTLTNLKNLKAINMNMKYLHLKSLDDGIFDTPHGPHQRIIYTQKLFNQVRESNEDKIVKLVGCKRFAERKIA